MRLHPGVVMNGRFYRAARSPALLCACLLLITSSGAPSSARGASHPLGAPPITRVTFPSQAYRLGAGGALAMVAGDFNGDGFRDVAVSNRGENDPIQGRFISPDVSILLGYGDGTLAPQIHLATPRASRSIAAADFNRDGRDDLAIAFVDRGEVGVFISNGDGSFGQPTIYSQGTGGGSVKTGDFNGDGFVDLVATAGGGTVAVWLGGGDGTFSLAGTFPGGKNILAGVAINIAGKNENVFGNFGFPQHTEPEDVTLTLGRGDGTFDAPIHVAISPFSVNVADFDGDGFPDLTSGNSIIDSIAILRGSGDGTFTPWLELPLSRGSVIVADFNGDSRPDLTVRGYFGDLNVLLNDGEGHFERSDTVVTLGAGAILGADDFEGDGKKDLIVAYDYQGRPGDLEIHRGRGDGTFDSRRDYAAAGLPRSVAIADFNLDDRPDVAVAREGEDTNRAGSVSIFLGARDGSLLAGVKLQDG